MYAPAPWGLLPYEKTDIHQGHSIVDANGKPIAAVKSQPYFESVEQLEATALLISQAPTLLEAFKYCIEIIERLQDIEPAERPAWEAMKTAVIILEGGAFGKSSV